MNRRRGIFVAVTVSVSFGIALVCAEMVLRLQSASVRGSESMAPGLIGYDRELGWRLQPDWQGTHRHHDYSVQYHINDRGFRGPWPVDDDRTRVVLVGDSFTFGLGVADEATFARCLATRAREPEWQVINLGVPGYSTDQETLLLEEMISELQADRVVVIVCLINDVFDNERLFPLQAMYGKPRFRLDEDGGLKLENVPVPMDPKPPSEMKENLASLVMGDTPPQQSSVAQWLGRQQIVRRLGLFQPSFEPPDGFFEERFESSLTLFDALVARARGVAVSAGATFDLALLPGRSLVEEPESYSARYQEFLRRSLSQRAESMGIGVIDLALPLIKQHQSDATPLFHPHDGHLNAAGHAAVAELIHDGLGRDAKTE